MSKNAKRGILTLAILLVVFSIIAFVVPFPRTTVFWIAYACGVFAILFQAYIFKSSFGKENAKSRFYGFPIARLGMIYLVVQLAVSLALFEYGQNFQVWVVVVFNVLLIAAVLIGSITAETMREEITKQDGKLKKSVFNMRELQSISATLVDQCGDEELKKELKKLADEFRYSDPLSSSKTMALEADLQSRIGDLQQAIVDGDTDSAKILCSKISGCLKERNRVCALSK